MVYYFLILGFVIIWYLLVYRTRLPKTVFLAGSLFVLFLFSSFRYRTIGADYPSYISAFDTIGRTGTYYMEPGYVLFNRIVRHISSQYYMIAIAVNLLFLIPVFLYLKTQVEEKNWPLCIFAFTANPYMYLQTSFNLMRQACAVGLILFSVICYYNKRLKPFWRLILFIIFAILAAQFHKISYVFLIIPVIFEIKWKKVGWSIILLIVLFLYVVGRTSITDRIVTWLGYEQYLDYKSSLLSNPLYVLLIIVLAVFLISRYNNFKNTVEAKSVKYVNQYIFSILFLIVAVSNDMFYRVYMIASIVALPGLPHICDGLAKGSGRIVLKNEDRIVRLIFCAYYLCFFTGYILRLALRENASYIPYRFCF